MVILATMEKQMILGESTLLTQALEQLSLIAPLNKPVLVIGERGTGKELVAERLHFLSQRWQKPYLKINCAAISDTLLESTLFGHEAGSFTGAIKASKGYFERVEGGSLFLDELATVSVRVQEKLLRVIEYGEFERLGGQQSLNCDVRIIAATNADLPELARQGRFRADLLDRLAFDVINLPPLRFRQEDILILAEFFALEMSRELDREAFHGFSSSALKKLNAYAWPGNIRELKNAVQRSVYRQQDEDALIDEIILDPFQMPWSILETAPPSTITTEKNQPSLPAHPDTLATTAPPQDFETQVSHYKISLVKKALEQQRFHQKNTANVLGMTYHQLRAFLKKHPDLLQK